MPSPSPAVRASYICEHSAEEFGGNLRLHNTRFAALCIQLILPGLLVGGILLQIVEEVGPVAAVAHRR